LVITLIFKLMLAQNFALIVLFFSLLFKPLRALGALTAGLLEAEITLFVLGGIFLDILTQKLFRKIQNQIENNRSRVF
jgi:hypothetical protein